MSHYPTDQEISDRAHALWQKEGEPEGRSDEFWLRAKDLLETEARASAEGPPPPKPHDSSDAEIEHSFPASDPPSSSPISNTSAQAPAKVGAP